MCVGIKVAASGASAVIASRHPQSSRLPVCAVIVIKRSAEPPGESFVRIVPRVRLELELTERMRRLAGGPDCPRDDIPWRNWPITVEHIATTALAAFDPTEKRL